MSGNSADEGIATDVFESSCPYNQPGVVHGTLYRLIEEFDGNSSHYVGDSYGGRSYINVNVPRGCSQSCACHKPYMSERYVFTVRKSLTTMVVETHYSLLNAWLTVVLPIASGISNGFLLLKHLDLLEEYFRAFQEKETRYVRYKILGRHELERLEATLSLLIEGLLTDPQVFTSFGYQRLCHQGYLSYERWKKLHSSRTTDNIDMLEASYDEDQDPPDTISTMSSNFAPFPETSGQSVRSCQVKNPRDHGEFGEQNPKRLLLLDLESHRGEFERLEAGLLGMIVRRADLNDFGTCAIPKRYVEGPLAIDLLIESVATEDLSLLQVLLRNDAPANTVFSAVPAPRDYLATTLIFRAKGAASRRDLMTVAARVQDHLMCKYFMSNGASFSQTLLAAVRNGDLKCAYFLLQMAASERGRQDIDFMLPLRRMAGELTMLEKESKNVSLSNEEVETRQSRKRPSLRRFHVAFKQEHLRITKYAESWVDRPCFRRNKAFKKGIGVLRGLCKGQTPSTVSETVCFLAIARAMSIATNEHSNLACRMLDFERDLGRWQMPFKMEDGTLPAFRNAVAGIWNVILDGTQVQHPDPSTLMKFCDLAFSIVQHVDNCFDLSSCSSSRLLSSQKKWRVQVSSTPDAELADHNFHHLTPKTSKKKPHSASSGAPYFTWYQDRDPLPTQVPDITMREAISNNRYLWSTNPLVRLLMAGAIFGIIITFLLGLRIDHEKPLCSIPSTSVASLFHGQQQTMIDAVDHMFKAVVPEIQPETPVVESMKNAVYTAVAIARPRTFQALTDLLATQDFSRAYPNVHECTDFQCRLIEACIIWEPSYALQQRYQVLEAYLDLDHIYQ